MVERMEDLRRRLVDGLREATRLANLFSARPRWS